MQVAAQMLEKNGKSRDEPEGAPTLVGMSGLFPETKTEILAQAAAGEWRPFLDAYLRPCWQEVVLACRHRRLAIDDAEDLYQDLMLRLLQDTGFHRSVQIALAEVAEAGGFRGNMPGRYLQYRSSPLRSARFRTYLKHTIQNLVFEMLRRSCRRPKQLQGVQENALEPWIEQSVSSGLDRPWLKDVFYQAAVQFRTECEKARSRGKRRLFEILYLADGEDCSSSEIGHRLALDRTTVSGLLRDARTRLVAIVQEHTGVTESAELKKLLTTNFKEFKIALSRAWNETAKQ
jgi:DNA-directed RNA polymerase specialized sigma24 family protein